MSITTFKNARYTAPTVFVTLICFLATLMPPRVSRADNPALAPIGVGTGGQQTLGGPPLSTVEPNTQVTADLSTGAARTQYAFQLPRARGDAQPSLALQYNSSQGVGFAGVGWTLNLPSIVRKGVRGLPKFTDAVLTSSSSSFSGSEDEYYIDGQLLVPIAVLNGNSGGLPGETFPPWAVGASAASPGGFVYFRREVDDGSRYFLSGDGQGWVVQTKSGHLLYFGHPLDGSGTGAPLSDGREYADPMTANIGAHGASLTKVYRWNLVRDWDASGNIAYYVWDTLSQLVNGAPTGGTLYLTDIYDTMSPSVDFGPAHHVHLTWALMEANGPIFTVQGPAYATSPDLESAAIRATEHGRRHECNVDFRAT